ncbi:MAG TPA: M17 family peptidase N-terminal domain-containing protein, partial [Telluria sp.]
MDFSIKAFDTKNPIAAAKTGCIAVAVFENKKLSQAAKALDQDGDITAALKSGDITGKPGSTLLLRGAGGAAAARVLLVGMGADEAVSEKSFTSAVAATLKAFSQLGAADAIIALPMTDVKERDLDWAVRAIVCAAHESVFRTDTQKSKKDPAPTGVRKITLATPSADSRTKTALAQAEAIANGMDLTKELGNLSANICTPTYLASTARKLAKEYRF